MNCLHPPRAQRRVLVDDGAIEYRINSLGLRGPAPGINDRSRTLVLGGSTVEDIALGDGSTWCDQLARRLGRGHWVGNAGRAGMRLEDHLAHLDALLPLIPGLTRIVVLCGLNDMLADCGLHRGPSDGSATFGWVDGAPLPGDAAQEYDLASAIGSFKARRAQVGPDDFVADATLDESALDRYRGLVRAVSSRAGAVPALFLTQPACWVAEPSAAHLERYYAGGVGPVEGWFANPRARWLEPGLLARLLAAYNGALLASSVATLDLARRVGTDPALFYDDFHLSAAGAARVAAVVAAALSPAPASVYPLW